MNVFKLNFIAVLIVCLYTPLEIYAQVAPSLTAGINNVTYTKGQLDADLIAEIIATKRGEIKTEFAKRLILQKFECGSFAVYNYVSKTIDLLLNETNKETISKGLLANSAELLMVYGFAEFYLSELSYRANKGELQNYEIDFLCELGKWADLNNSEKIDFSFKTDLVSSRENASGLNYMQNQNSENGYLAAKRINVPPAKSQLLPDMQYLSMLTNSKKSYSESRNDCWNIAPNHIYIDMIFEILRSSHKVRETGFFRGVSDNINASKNKFLRIKNDPVSMNIYNNLTGSGKGKELQVWNSIKNRVDKIFSFYRTLSTLKSSIDVDDTSDSMLIKINNELSGFDFDSITFLMNQSTIKKYYDLCQKLDVEFKETLIPLDRNQVPNFSQEDKELMISLKNTIDQLKRLDFKKAVYDLEYYRLYIETELIPKVMVLNSQTFQAYKNTLANLEMLSDIIRKRGLLGVKTKIDKRDSDKTEDIVEDRTFFLHFQYYIHLVDVINNLDQVESYDKIFSFIASTVNTLSNQKARNVFSNITNTYDAYLSINKQENQIELDVESMAVNLYERYGKNTSTRLGLYFSVGVNSQFDFDKSTIMVDGDTTSSKFTYVSEKLGIRYNIVDFNRKYTLGFRPQKPIVNNVHVLAYTSGLLYQIDFLNSNDEFTSPLYGAGLGFTFFNGLDFNASYAVPFENNLRDGLWSLGFDIRITEYLSALKKKKN